MDVQSFLIGFLVAGSIGAFQAVRIVVNEFNDPVLEEGEDNWIIYIAIGMICLYVLALMIVTINWK